MLFTGGGSAAATGGNAVAKGATAANATSKVSKLAKVSNFANKLDQVFNVAKSLNSADFLGAIDNVKALKAPLQAADDVARLGKTKAFIKNPSKYAKNYANNIKGNVKIGTAQLERNIKGFMEGAENIVRNPKQAIDDFTTQLSKDTKKTQLTGKLAYKNFVKGMKSRKPEDFQKALEFMNKNPLVQGLNTGMTKANNLIETIKDPLKPLTSRLEGAVTNNFNNNFTGAGQRVQEGIFDTLQTTAQQEELKEEPKKEKAEPKKEAVAP
jgi:flagellar biosynthesis chaperone FliJ